MKKRDMSCEIFKWMPFSELRPISQNISRMGYNKDYIKNFRLEETKSPHNTNMITGTINFFEPLEVKSEANKILWRYNDNHVHRDIPKQFETQFGIFINHNHGEFTSWLGKEGYAGCTDKEKEINKLLGRDDFFIEGNYCDMFDSGNFTYAISNQMHFGLGIFKIVRIDKNFETVNMYENYRDGEHTRLEYFGRFMNSSGYIIIGSGVREDEHERGSNRKSHDITILFQIDKNGGCEISKEWNFSLASSNSIAKLGDYIYFGQNKMITRLNVITGDIAYFTNKTDEEINALEKMW